MGQTYKITRGSNTFFFFPSLYLLLEGIKDWLVCGAHGPSHLYYGFLLALTAEIQGCRGFVPGVIWGVGSVVNWPQRNQRQVYRSSFHNRILSQGHACAEWTQYHSGEHLGCFKNQQISQVISAFVHEEPWGAHWCFSAGKCTEPLNKSTDVL